MQKQHTNFRLVHISPILRISRIELTVSWIKVTRELDTVYR